MPLIQAQNDARVFLSEDCSAGDVSEDFVGRKAFSLFQLKDMDVPVPPFVALSGSIFSEYIAECLSPNITGKTTDEEIREKITNKAFPLNARNEIMEGYSRLSGFTDTWVSVRSSIVLPVSHRNLAFAGMLDTVLNVRGHDDLIASIKQVYASAFTSKVAGYLSDQGLSIADIKVGIVVQKMVQSEASGVVFTVDPISLDENYLNIEAVFGLGTVIADGEITPDQYVINKKDLEFKEKKIVPQEWMMVRKIKHKEGEGGEQKVKISKSWQQQQKLENRYIKELSKIATIVEKKSGEPQDIEWVFEGGRTWLLQTAAVEPVVIPRGLEQPIKVESSIVAAAEAISKRETSKQNAKAEIKKRKAKKMDQKKEKNIAAKLAAEKAAAEKAAAEKAAAEKAAAEKAAAEKAASEKAAAEEVITQKPLARQVLQGGNGSETESIARFSPLPGEKLLLTGIGASDKTFRGTVCIVADADDLSAKSKSITDETVLVMPEHFSEIDSYLGKVGAIISDKGGTTSDIATICREKDIPCIMGSHIASKMLRDEEVVLVDGAIGAVYGMRDIVSEQPEPQKQAGITKKLPKKKTSPPVSTPVSQAASPKAVLTTATKVYADLSESLLKGDAWKEQVELSDGIAVVQVEDIYQKIGKHPNALIKKGPEKLIKSIASELSSVCEVANEKTVIVSIGNLSVSEYKNLPKGKNLEEVEGEDLNENAQGLLRLLRHPKEVEAFFKAVRHVRNAEGWRTLTVAINYAGTPKYLAEFKKMLSSAGLRRSSTFNLYLTVSTPSEAMILEDFVKVGVDGIIVNVKQLANHMMASSVDDSSVLKVLKEIQKSSSDKSTILNLPRKAEAVLKKSVKLGYNGIALQPGDIALARKVLSDLERDAILKGV